MRAIVCLLAISAVAADYSSVNPVVVPESEELSKQVRGNSLTDVKSRMQRANQKESEAFAAVKSKAEWERYRDVRISALRNSLGTFPETPKNLRVVVTRTINGDGFIVRNLVYETRPGNWVSANLYLPVKPTAAMPGILISHSHHGGKSHSELRDMGATWARSGAAVLVPDHLGYTERRQHEFRTEKDYPKPFRTGRQDYYFRFNTNLQLSLVGDSLMGWMVCDLMRGVDVLLQQPGIDPKRIILLGSVAGGGDPAGVTAALDPRIACLVPFNFGGWQPESRVTESPDRDFPWFGDGYWESTRGLRGGAAGGFAHFVIVGSIAPRKLIYSHEFAWNAANDPAYPRLQKIYGFYDSADSLRVAHGSGNLQGRPPESSHCTHIGAVHRKMIYPALRDWFGMPIPEEYSNPIPVEQFACWTDDARRELQPKKLHELLAPMIDARIRTVEPTRENLTKFLGSTEPTEKPAVAERPSEPIPGGTLTRFTLTVEPGIVVPVLLLKPERAAAKSPVVVMVSATGKQAFLWERGDEIAEFLKAGWAVCLPDVRGTGESRTGDGSPSRTSARTSIAQMSLMLGQPVLGAQLRDLRTVLRWLGTRSDIDGKAVAMWGDSFVKPNPADATLTAPLDAPDFPAIAEPTGTMLAEYATVFEPTVKAAYTRGGWDSPRSIVGSPYVYVPLEAAIPAHAPVAGSHIRREATVDGRNRPVGPQPTALNGVAWLKEKVAAK